MFQKMLFVLVATLAPATLMAESGGDTCSAGGKSDIVATAVGAGKFDTLVAAVKAADLVSALQAKGPFTVFAPTNEAFARLPEGTVQNLLRPENKKALAGILTYHVVPGRLDAKHVIASGGAVTLNGQRIDFSRSEKGVMVDGAKVIMTDIECSNGIIHVIDRVILPSSDNLVATAKNAKVFNTLLTAAKEAGLAGALQGDGPFTVFAPTDEAFGKLPAGTVETLLKPENREQLAAILKFHVVSGRVYAKQALKAGTAKTLLGPAVSIEVVNGQPRVQEANILKTDIDASNGVIHVIDSVILPPSKETAARL